MRRHLPSLVYKSGLLIGYFLWRRADVDDFIHFSVTV
jgi:hypothetical protein